MRRQTSTQWAELLSGLAACAVGLLALGIVLFAPITSYASGSTYQSFYVSSTRPEVQGMTSLVQAGLAQPGMEPVVWSYLSTIVACLIAVALSAALHSRSGLAFWRVLLWIATVLLFGLMVLGLASIGLFLAPACLLALGAAYLSLSAQPATPEPV